MYKQCETEQSAARQRQMEQGLLEMMLRKHFEEFTVSDLCAYLEIPRKSFYRYFSGKEGALHALIDHAFTDFDSYEAIGDKGQNIPPAVYMERVFRYWMECKPLLDALERSGLSGVLIQRAIDYSKEMENLPMFLSSVDKQMQDYGTMFAICGLMTMMVQWHHDGFTPGPEQMAKLALRLFSQPLFPKLVL